MATVLIVEDDPLMRQHFELAVAAHPKLTLFGSVGSCKACRALLHERPDVMLVDLGLPDGNGTSLIRQLKSMHPSAEAIVVSVFAEEDKVVGAIRAGASGYLLKDMFKENIGASIMDVLGGGSPISPSIARYILKALSNTDDAPADEHIAPVELSRRETEVLNLIARGYSRKEIASLLVLSRHTVVSHIRHIYEKLEVHSRNEAVFEACQQGLIKLYD
ncbi:response regulator transcription factor [Mariprofundus ferrooxydans]|nr:response regulator transcription factor [Mariprofundus ferrooxydans]